MVKPRDVSVSVHESNGALKVNVSFSIPGTIGREWAQSIDPSRFLRVDEKDRKRIQKQIAKEVERLLLQSTEEVIEYDNKVSMIDGKVVIENHQRTMR